MAWQDMKILQLQAVNISRNRAPCPVHRRWSPGADEADHKRRFTRVKFKLICYGCGKATNEGYHVLAGDTICHYCTDCLEDEEAAKENEEIRAIEKF
jgi:hypothetical protein